MSQTPPGTNPYDASGITPNSMPQPEYPQGLTAVDWLVAVLCSGIGCIIGIIRLIQGRPNGGKMLGISLLFMFIWTAVRMLIIMASEQR